MGRAFDEDVARAIEQHDDELLARIIHSDHGRMSHPTPDHYLPLLYAIGAASANGRSFHIVRWFPGTELPSEFVADHVRCVPVEWMENQRPRTLVRTAYREWRAAINKVRPSLPPNTSCIGRSGVSIVPFSLPNAS